MPIEVAAAEKVDIGIVAVSFTTSPWIKSNTFTWNADTVGGVETPVASFLDAGLLNLSFADDFSVNAHLRGLTSDIVISRSGVHVPSFDIEIGV